MQRTDAPLDGERAMGNWERGHGQCNGPEVLRYLRENGDERCSHPG